MATNQQNINLGSADNANDGDVLRAAFRKVRKMFAEIYGDTDAENLTDSESVPSTNFDTHITEKIQDVVGSMVTGNTENNITVTYDDSDGTLDFDVAADITDVNAGSGLTGTNEDGGSATLNVGAGDGITVNADEVEVAVDDTTIELSASDGTGTIRIKDNAVTHDKLENRYTAKATSSATGSQNLDASTASTFLTGNITTATLTIQNMKLGQSIDIVLSGTLTSAVITLADDFTTSTISKVGGDLDTAETNIIQVICLDDTDSAAKLVYSINKYVTDTTP